MSRRTIVTTALLSLLVAGALPQLAGGAPTPLYTLSCTSGYQGQLTATWQRVKLVQVTVDWAAPAGADATYPQVAAPATPTPPKGFLVTVTPISGGVQAASATLSFTRADGVVDQRTVVCS
jgi:hypothetical protein